jgi:hypothetical protein
LEKHGLFNNIAGTNHTEFASSLYAGLGDRAASFAMLYEVPLDAGFVEYVAT